MDDVAGVFHEQLENIEFHAAEKHLRALDEDPSSIPIEGEWMDANASLDGHNV